MGMFWSLDDFIWPSYGHFMGIVTGVNGDVMGFIGILW